MLNRMLRMAVTTTRELEHPADARPLYTSAVVHPPPTSPTDDYLTSNLFSEPAHHLDYTMCLMLFLFCAAEVLILKIIVGVMEYQVLERQLRGERSRARLIWLQRSTGRRFSTLLTVTRRPTRR